MAGSRPAIPHEAAWATFLRNHDELTLDKLTDDERDEVFAAFGPDPDMQLYGRGIRRRLPTMMDGDQPWLRLAYGLMFALPGTPTIFYGEEIGMGENLDDRRPGGRADADAVDRWTDGRVLQRPARRVVPTAADRPRLRSGRRQRPRPATRPGLPAQLVRTADPPAARTFPRSAGVAAPCSMPAARSVLALRHDWQERTVITVHNLARRTAIATFDVDDADGAVLDELLDRDVASTAIRRGRARVRLGGHEQRWLRLDRQLGRRRRG